MLRILFLFLPIVGCCIHPGSRITYEFSGGRLGDNLLVYVNTLYLSYKYKIPILYKPFEYSDSLYLHKINSTPKSKFFQTIILDKNNIERIQEIISVNLPFLLVVPWGLDTKTNLQEKKFKELVNDHIKPLKTLNTIKPEEKSKSIALHFREGGGFDPNGWHRYFPLKCPSIYYYVDCLNYISKKIKNSKIHCHIFTDHNSPKDLADSLKKNIQDPNNFTFTYREKANHHNKNVLEDLFSMPNFDILIRPQSAYSLTAEYLGNFNMVFEPIESIFENDKSIITKILIKTPKKNIWFYTR